MVRDAAEVDEMVRRCRPLADQQAALVLARVPRSVDRSDLQSAALFGLYQAAVAWEPDRGVRFETFARHRIRGALLDELRARDWASRRVRLTARRIAESIDELTLLHGRRPTDAEVAAHLGVPVSVIESNERDLHAAAVRSCDTFDEETVPASTGPDPETALVDREQSAYLHDAVALLPERLRRVVIGYYVEELPMQVLGDELGVTESRVSQMRAEAVRLLRAVMTGALGAEQLGRVAVADHVSARALEMLEALEDVDPRDRLGAHLDV
jgi:RNA polymerase sigma factor for flagellar operon FliA